jgi:hypothetical protein
LDTNPTAEGKLQAREGSHIVVYEPEELYDKSLRTERREAYAQQGSRGGN